MKPTGNLQVFTSREAACDYASTTLSATLEGALAARGQATFMGSGGTSPGAVYRKLSNAPIDWAATTIGLVDERWVSTNDMASNERLLREQLLIGPAARAHFLPMKSNAATSEMDAMIADTAYRKHAPGPYDAVLFGMGTDGHTASWFPDAAGLEAAIDPSNPAHVAAIDATGSSVAGKHPQRLTLTLSALGTARTAVLLAFGAEKHRLLETARMPGKTVLPVNHALAALGARLTIIWAP